jgi:iron complex outermembrane receptor protein
MKSGWRVRGETAYPRAHGEHSMIGISRGHFRIGAALLALATGLQSAHAAEGQPASAEDAETSGIVVTGARGIQRTAAESPTPIDTLSGEQLQSTGKQSLKETLSKLLPSFNFGTTNGNVHNNIVRPYSMRGLGAAYTLVLVNGKRRHRSSLLLNSNLDSSGATPVDIDQIPVTSIERIEVLRDGAAAQYGSDAIAGVINIILKKGEGGRAIALTGQKYEGDGEAYLAAADLGFRIGEGGSLHLAFEARANQRTDRNDDATGTFYFPGDPREATALRRGDFNGDPRLRQLTLSQNLELPLGDVTFYSYGTLGRREARAYQTRRRPNAASNIPEIHPDGFVPDYQLKETDFQLLAGLKGEAAGWNWDVSTTYGSDKSTSSADTLNPSLGPSGPTHFVLYRLRSKEWISNIDISRGFDMGLASPLNVAFGAEYRQERYAVGQGDPDAYANGGYIFTSGPLVGTPAWIGVQGVNSIDSGDDGRLKRSNIAGYLDLGVNITRAWFVGVAGRAEHFSDSAGDTFSYKINTRYDIAPGVGLRGTISTGFRAPSLAQSLYGQRRYTQQVVAGQLLQFPTKNFRVDSPVALALGATPLTPEKTVNYSLGLALQPIDGLNVTVDGYQIDIDDRIAQTTALNGRGIDALLVAAGLQPGIYAQYFTNAIDTRTRGVDIVTDYKLNLGSAGNLRLGAAANWNKTRITRVRPNPSQLASLGTGLILFDRVQQGALTVGYPKSKIILSVDWTLGGLSATVRATRYGSVIQRGTAVSGVDDRTYGAKILTDLEVSYAVTPKTRIAIGADNLFDVYPDPVGIVSVNGAGRYGSFSPFGMTGGLYYARISHDF